METMNLDNRTQKAFDKILGKPMATRNPVVLTPDQARNERRMEAYKKRCAAHVMIEHTFEGERVYNVGFTKQEAKQRALVVTGGDDLIDPVYGPVRVKA
jgi:hypothetical protein